MRMSKWVLLVYAFFVFGAQEDGGDAEGAQDDGDQADELRYGQAGAGDEENVAGDSEAFEEIAHDAVKNEVGATDDAFVFFHFHQKQNEQEKPQKIQGAFIEKRGEVPLYLAAG